MAKLLKTLRKMKRRDKWLIGIVLAIFLCPICAVLTPDKDPETKPTIQNTVEALVVSTQTAAPLRTETRLPSATFTDQPTFSPTVITTTPNSNMGFSCIPNDSVREVGTVVKIIDGDTIYVDIDGRVWSVRYIGIDSPESTIEKEAFGDQATEANSALVSGSEVTLVKDVSNTDRYDRLLRYVFVGDIFVNYELVRTGFATASSYPPDTACDDAFLAAENEAITSVVGLWGATAITTSNRLSSDATDIVDSNCDPSYPDVCIPPAPPDLDCKDVPYRNFVVLPPDPHNFDGNKDGRGCEGQN